MALSAAQGVPVHCKALQAHDAQSKHTCVDECMPRSRRSAGTYPVRLTAGHKAWHCSWQTDRAHIEVPDHNMHFANPLKLCSHIMLLSIILKSS